MSSSSSDSSPSGVFGAFHALSSSRPKTKKRKIGFLTDSQTRTLARANEFYIAGKYEDAMPLLMEVVRAAPDARDAYVTIGAIHEACGRKEKALETFIWAATVGGETEAGRWKELAEMANEVGNVDQMVFCWGRILKVDRKDFATLWKMSVHYRDNGNEKKAMKGFMKILQLSPNEPTVLMELVKLHNATRSFSKVLELYDEYFSRIEDKKSIDLDLSNVVLEVLIKAEMWQKVFYYQSLFTLHHIEAPLDITVKFGIASLHLGYLADQLFAPLWLCAEIDYEDLFLDVANAYYETGNYDKAVEISRAMSSNAFDRYSLLARALEATKNYEDALLCTTEILEKFELDKEIISLHYQLLLSVKGEEVANQFRDSNDFSVDLVKKTRRRRQADSKRRVDDVSRKRILAGETDSEVQNLIASGYVNFEKGNYDAFLSLCLPIAVALVNTDVDESLSELPNPFEHNYGSSSNFIKIVTNSLESLTAAVNRALGPSHPQLADFVEVESRALNYQDAVIHFWNLVKSGNVLCL